MCQIRSVHVLVVGLFFFALAAGCAGTRVPLPDAFPATPTVVFGKVRVELSGLTNRWFLPELEFVELLNHDTHKRFRIDFKAKQSLFLMSLPEGYYELVRVQIAEGAFRSMAQLSSSFRIHINKLTYLGTWTFVVAPPYYDRAVTMTVASEFPDTVAEIRAKYPDYPSRVAKSALPSPLSQEARLYEVMPYPRVKYFRRNPAT